MAQNEAPTQVLTAHAVVDAEVRDALERLARANNRSIAGEIRTALEEHLARQTEGDT